MNDFIKPAEFAQKTHRRAIQEYSVSDGSPQQLTLMGLEFWCALARLLGGASALECKEYIFRKFNWYQRNLGDGHVMDWLRILHAKSGAKRVCDFDPGRDVASVRNQLLLFPPATLVLLEMEYLIAAAEGDFPKVEGLLDSSKVPPLPKRALTDVLVIATATANLHSSPRRAAEFYTHCQLVNGGLLPLRDQLYLAILLLKQQPVPGSIFPDI
jgi:hypothetical protein